MNFFKDVQICPLMHVLRFLLAVNVLQLPEGGDFEALHCQPSTNFDRSTKLDLTTEPPLLGRCCYRLAGILSVVIGRLCFLQVSKYCLGSLCHKTNCCRSPQLSLDFGYCQLPNYEI